MRCCCRRYTFAKFIGDMVLLILTSGLWVAYMVWRFFRQDRCCCAARRWNAC